jgi:membrane protein DedA with SNARE-associated domain
MSGKRSEVVKLALFSLVIVLGISIDRMLTYYLSKYIGENILTDFQELLLRLSYPITIFLLLWIFKAL